MTDARVSRFCQPTTDSGVLPAGADPAKACGLDLVSKGVGRA